MGGEGREGGGGAHRWAIGVRRRGKENGARNFLYFHFLIMYLINA